MHFTDELLESSLTPEDKMDDWHNGKRKENINACGDAKLKTYYEICMQKDYNHEADQIRQVALNRNLPWAVKNNQTKITNSKGWAEFSADEFDNTAGQVVYDHKNDISKVIKVIDSLDVTKADKVHTAFIRLIVAIAFGLSTAAIALRGFILSNTKLDKSDIDSILKGVWEDDEIIDKLTSIRRAVENKKESLEEDTVKIKDHKWTNKGKEGTHGTFTTKKAADAQRKAMFANGYHETLQPGNHVFEVNYEKKSNLPPFEYMNASCYVQAKDKIEAIEIAASQLSIDKSKINDAIQVDLINEDIEKHDELNPKLFEDNKLKPEVREKVVSIVEEFVKNLKEDGIRFGLKDIILVGSNCSYNYTKDSDLDIHLIADTNNLDCSKEVYDKLYSAYRSLFNKNLDIDFYGIPVEIYIELEGLPRVSNGVYSVMSDSWLKEPVKDDIPELDKKAFDKELKVWEDRYNEVIGEKDLDESLTEDKESDTNRAREIIADQIRGEWDADRGYTKAAADLAELKDIDTKEAQEMMLDIASEEHVHVGELETAYSAFDSNLFDELEDGHNEAENNAEPAEDLEFPEPEEYTEEPIEIEDEEIEESLNEEIHNDQLDSINQFIDDIYALRKDSISKDGEYGIGNLIFKEIRNKGYLDNLKELKNKIIGDELSLK